MLGNQRTPERTPVVIALVLQAIVLLWLTITEYNKSMTSTIQYVALANWLFSLIFSGLGITAIWLAREHYSKILKRNKLQLWAILCIIPTLFQMIVSIGTIIYFDYSLLDPYIILIQSLLFLAPTIMVLLFSKKEIITDADLSN